MIITIVGGGIAGCSAALKLAELSDDYKIRLVDSRSELLAGSSDDTPCRIGLGFHYIDSATALRYLRNSVRFVRTYKNLDFPLRVAEGERIDHPRRRGRYFITRDSLFPPAEILRVYDLLKAEYQSLVDEDPENAVFGPPADFYRILEKREYAGEVTDERVAVGIETAEHILDWPRFKEYLISQVKSHPNIEVALGTEVLGISRSGLSQFELRTKKVATEAGEEEETEKTDFIVNCSWYNIEKLNKTAGIPAEPEKRTHRVKIIIEVDLPPALHDSHSMFFCFGPHCSLTNIGNGKGWLSYEPVTNIAATSSLILPAELEALVSGAPVSEELKRTLGQRIINGAAEYMPALIGAIYRSAKIGVVRTQVSSEPAQTLVDGLISSPESAIHRRDHLCVKSSWLNWIDNPCMKLLYFQANAEVVGALFKTHLATCKFLTEIVGDMISSIPKLTLREEGLVEPTPTPLVMTAEGDCDGDSTTASSGSGGEREREAGGGFFRPLSAEAAAASATGAGATVAASAVGAIIGADKSEGEAAVAGDIDRKSVV